MFTLTVMMTFKGTNLGQNGTILFNIGHYKGIFGAILSDITAFSSHAKPATILAKQT